jgi:hypothetical protein
LFLWLVCLFCNLFVREDLDLLACPYTENNGFLTPKPMFL